MKYTCDVFPNLYKFLLTSATGFRVFVYASPSEQGSAVVATGQLSNEVHLTE